MTALLIGSISTVADTSERQRSAFNDAFREHGLDWEWDRDTYRSLLDTAGGRDRIAAWASEKGQDVDADAVHATKSDLFQTSLRNGQTELRAGVKSIVEAARTAGDPVAFVTTTSRANIDALFAGLKGQLSADDFDLVLCADDVESPKPDGSVYRLAIERLDVDTSDAVAVEDNVDGVAAAVSAGLRCVAFPNENTKDHDFSGAENVVERLDRSLIE